MNYFLFAESLDSFGHDYIGRRTEGGNIISGGVEFGDGTTLAVDCDCFLHSRVQVKGHKVLPLNIPFPFEDHRIKARI